MIATSPPALVVLDCETTGLDPCAERILEIAAVRLDGSLAPVDRLTTLVDPERPVALETVRLTGIDPADLVDAPRFSDVWPDLERFAAGAVIVGHNVDFDLGFVSHELQRLDRALPWSRQLDTLEAALLLLPELDGYRLDAIAGALGLTAPRHRALADAETTAELLPHLCRRLSELTEQERRLLEAAAWTPLATLSGYVPAAGRPARPAAERRPADDRPPALDADPAGWRSAFESDGELGRRLPGYRSRPAQAALAEEVGERLATGGVALLEAGTGMGKSLAYLLPAAHHAAAHGRRVIVSTRTKALQRQLASRELPLVQDLLPSGLRWAVLMGRENYLCRRRLDAAAAETVGALPDPERALALAYLLGRSRLGEADLSSLPLRATRALPALGEVARSVASSSAACLRYGCPAREQCPWRRARARAAASHLVCVNHALLLRGPAALPEADDVIVDEAHLLPDEAENALSREVGSGTLDDLLDDLRGRGRRQQSLADRLRRAVGDGAPDAVAALARAADTLPQHGSALKAGLDRLMAEAGESEESGYARTLWLRPGLREAAAWGPFADACAALAELVDTAGRAAAQLGELLPEDHREAASCVAVADLAMPAAALLADVQEPTDAHTVIWAEVGPRGGASPTDRWKLTAAPLTPGPGLRAALWDRLRSACLLSATLTTGGSFSYYRRQTGLDADVEVVERVFPSPFDYRRQAVLVLEHDPECPYDAGSAPVRHIERLCRLVAVTGGRLLALFTNRRQMEAVAAAVGPAAEDDGVVLLTQGVHGSAASLADEFRAHPATALLGVDALWTGQDFPGDTLVCLVIAKLPFPRLSPLVRARREAAEEEGLDWFGSLYLPEAILRFRQGFGRLIRTEDDRGVVVVLDPRLTQKRYGARFLESLPGMEVVRARPDELPAVVEERLRRLGALT